MNFFEYTFKGVNYEFRMSNKAKVLIEEEQMKLISEISKDEELIKTVELINQRNKEEHNEESDVSFGLKMAPAITMMQKIETIVEPIQLGYILLHSIKKYSALTKDEYEELIEDMEENLGFQKVQETFKEIHDKVFSLIETMNNPNQKSKKKKMN